MLKIVTVIIIVCICGYVGFELSKYYISRKKFFVELSVFLNSLNVDINFTQEKLHQILEKNIANISSQDLKMLILNFKKAIENKQKVEKFMLFENISILNGNEKDIIFTFFKGVGRLDCTNQTKEFEKFLKVIDSTILETSKEASKYSSLYTKLGIIFGLFLALILI